MERKIWSVILSLIVCCIFARCEGNGCNSVSGPGNGFICSNQSSSIADYQWYVCMNDECLQILTGGSDQCPDGDAYCWRSCSVEDQSARCTCSEQATFPPHTPLPIWCFTPPGKTCNWYRECLNVKQPCNSSKYDYALSFGERFCKAYDKTYHTFSARAKEWIDAVRRCLQVKLVYILRPWESLSCQEIQAEAFGSHTGCYLSPAPGAPSICSLGALDWWRVFWTIKGAFVSETYQLLKGFLDIAIEGCFHQLGSKLPQGEMRVMALSITSKADTSLADELDTFPEVVADRIAKKLEWDSRTLDWYAYTQLLAKAHGSSDATQLILLLGDKTALGMARAAKISQATNLEEVVRQLSTAAESGYLDDIVQIESLKACSDLKCDRYESSIQAI